MNLEEKLYTSTEVAQILGVSLRSVYRYLEEGKLDAEVKTATGRHRFTKQNILDFLYPKDATTKLVPQPVREKPVEVRQRQTVPAKAVAEDEDTEEQVDWLAKFREAAKKFREEEAKQVEPVPVREEPAAAVSEPVYAEPVKPKATFNPFDSFKTDDDYEPKTDPTPVKEFYFYRSMLGGLKDIAQNIDRSARKSSVDYAFTRNAGLSLHKPIRPFSLLHAYVRPEDKEFFEKALHLVLSDENNAQLCLISTKEKEIFLTKRELHNLYVVSDNQLKRDLGDAGEDDLVAELNSVL